MEPCTARPYSILLIGFGHVLDSLGCTSHMDLAQRKLIHRQIEIPLAISKPDVFLCF